LEESLGWDEPRGITKITQSWVGRAKNNNKSLGWGEPRGITKITQSWVGRAKSNNTKTAASNCVWDWTRVTKAWGSAVIFNK
jgi:hypothetical protein